MRTSVFVAVASVLAVIIPGVGSAQAAKAPCPATPVAPPAELNGWGTRTPLSAAANAASLGAAQLAIGKATDIKLLPTPGVVYPTPPEKPGEATSHGGLAVFTVPSADNYRVALGAGAWIDVTSGGKAVASTAHGHGPDCSGVRKMVDFKLAAGRHVLQVAGSPVAVLPVMVVRLR